MTTEEIDVMAKEYTTKYGAVLSLIINIWVIQNIFVSRSTMLFVMVFLMSKLFLQEGDIVNVDATTMLNGYYADASRMFMIGKVSNEAKKLVSDTKKALELGMASVIPYQSCVWRHW